MSGARYTTIVAMLGAPVLACALVAAVVWLVVGREDSNWGFVLATFLNSAIVSVLTTVVLGPFVFSFMQRRNKRAWYQYAWVGAAVALAAMAIVAFGVALNNHSLLIIVAFIAVWAIPVGILTGVIGWAIRRPDRDRV